MLHQSNPLEEVDLFRTVTIREIEERSDMTCSDTCSDLANCIEDMFPGLNPIKIIYHP